MNNFFLIHRSQNYGKLLAFTGNNIDDSGPALQTEYQTESVHPSILSNNFHKIKE
jgi:hypothetical protein